MSIGWQKEIDRIIQSELEIAGFDKFYSDTYSFPISDYSIGLLRVYNPDPRHHITNAPIQTWIGGTHYQLQRLQTELLYPWNQNLCPWTFGGISTRSGVFVDLMHLPRDLQLEQKKVAIHTLVEGIKQASIPAIRDRLSTIDSIVELLRRPDIKDPVLLCIALTLQGNVAEAVEHAQYYTENLHPAIVHVGTWPSFKENFDDWIERGAPVPDLEESRILFIDAAKKKREEAASIAAKRRK